MKDKEKQIEEMARDLRYIKALQASDKYTVDYFEALCLYSLDYRKIQKDSIVLTKEQIKHPTDDKVIEFFIKHNEKVRKDTVETFAIEVYKELYQLGRMYALPETLDADKYGIFSLTQEVVAKIAKEQFGVEVE